MATTFISERNLRFLLYEVFDIETLLNYPLYADHSREVFDMVLDTAMKMGHDLFKPVHSEMDKIPPEYVDGTVKVHPVVRTVMQECGQGGWISASAPVDLGGQQMPITMTLAPLGIFSAANYSASVYPFLTSGSANLIVSFGSDDQKYTYLAKMYSGEWQGTMALTEPQAGSSLSDITTSAEPTKHGFFKIHGQKLFISAGDHDGADNIIHLVLARIKDAPAGVKGISVERT